MSRTELHLVRYYASVDRGDLETAAAMLHPAVAFALHLPAGPHRGGTREELIAYLSGRGAVVRRHVVMRACVDDDLELVYGRVVDGVEGQEHTTGHFLAAVRVDPDGLIASYQVSFDVELSLLDALAAGVVA